MTDNQRSAASNAAWAATEKAAETMWHDEFARVVIEQFARNATLTLEDLRRALEQRLGDEGTDRITKAKCRGALEALRA
ncbi:MAG: hypothetical protein IOD00_02800 [Rhodobacter sp.]|jgi:hypothetical protein|nr:hypothetical protein [Rhodobacter sp.]